MKENRTNQSGQEEQILVSVIMPVYNARDYLRRCLDSVTGQTLREIEIICVDDGSTDDSVSVLEQYRKKDPRIRIIRQENRYAGVARNTGFDVSKGRYTVFWDSDDFFDLTALEKMYRRMEKDRSDICICGAHRYNGDEDQVYPTGDYLVKKYLPDKIPFCWKDNPGYFFNITPPVPWNKMFRREFIRQHQIRYMPLKQENDVYFNMIALYLAQKISVVKEPLIYYRYFNSASLTGKISSTRMCTVEAFRAILQELVRLGAFAPVHDPDPDREKLRQSYINKAAGPLLFALRSQTEREGFTELFDAYHDSIFEELGIAGRPDEYFYQNSNLRQIRRIEEGDREAYLFQEMRQY